jgi:hypothetical protein
MVNPASEQERMVDGIPGNTTSVKLCPWLQRCPARLHIVSLHALRACVSGCIPRKLIRGCSGDAHFVIACGPEAVPTSAPNTNVAEFSVPPNSAQTHTTPRQIPYKPLGPFRVKGSGQPISSVPTYGSGAKGRYKRSNPEVYGLVYGWSQLLSLTVSGPVNRAIACIQSPRPCNTQATALM